MKLQGSRVPCAWSLFSSRNPAAWGFGLRVGDLGFMKGSGFGAGEVLSLKGDPDQFKPQTRSRCHKRPPI